MTMQVWPKNDIIRKVIFHPSGVRFRADGPSDWPDDSYTARRIRDGDVTTSEPGHTDKPAPPKPKSRTTE
jgi:hypothetical protein